MKYRPEIDGLRALSILLILIYHVDPAVIPGGFIGVDVFFVISGYLITKNITSDLADARFTFAGFYARRIKRIFPSVLLVLLACVVLGWHGLFAHEYAILGKHVAASAGFVSNFVYQAESGYFDLDSAAKPLLHLWSLAVEEQFYLVWPLIIWLVWEAAKRGGGDPAKWVSKAVILLAACSLGLASYLTLVDPAVVFYLSPARAWELCLGAWLTQFNAGQLGARWRSVLAWVGTLLVVGAGGLLNHDMVYPGFWVLLPVLGTACLIMAGPAGWAAGVLASRPMTGLGVLSFSIYLWHWPVLYFIRTFGWAQTFPNTVWLAVPVSLLLAWLSYRLVERPVRYLRSGWVAVVLLALMALIGLVGFNIYERGGMDFRERMTLENFGGLIEESDSRCLEIFSEYDPKFCRVHDPDRPVEVLLLGDSIGHNAFLGVAQSYAKQGLNVAMIGWPGVAPLLVPDSAQKLYEGDIDRKLKKLLGNLDDFSALRQVVFSFRLSYELPPPVREQIAPTLRLIRAQKKEVVYLLPPPRLSFNPIVCFGLPPLRPKLRDMCEIKESEMSQAYFSDRSETIRMLLNEKIPYFDAHREICRDGVCTLEFGGKVIYRNVRYLTAGGSSLVYGDFFSKLNR